jgi:mono/diheme cytochrome c family protein
MYKNYKSFFSQTVFTYAYPVRELTMNYRSLCIALVFAGFAVPAAADCDMTQTGKALAEKNHCAICHKDGGMAQPLAGIAEGKTDEFLKQSILNPKQTLGAGTRMPAYKFSDEEMKAMLHYLRSASKP